MAWDDGLVAGTAAHGVAASNHNRILLLAGPGTGKSYAMKRRVARILEEDGVNPGQVLAVTFTRVAAEDLHRELITLGVPGADLLTGKTLHSLAMSILMRNHVLAALGRTPRPLNKFELEPLLSDLSNKHGTKHQRKKKMLAYGAAWARLQTQEPGYARTPEDQMFVDDLVSWLRVHKAMLMDELIPHLYQYLQSNPGAPERTEYAHLLVDEYQDLNRAEQDVLHLLGENGSICVIGDDDQSIYSFRHAHPDGIRNWRAVHAADAHQIEECRRCPTTIVRMANALISRNTGRPQGRAMTERQENGGGEVAIHQYGTAEEECQAVTDKVATLVGAGVSPGEIIVLTQRETFATPIFNALRERAVPVKSYYAESDLDTLEAQERFATLKLVLDRQDEVALRWLLGYGAADWRKNSYRRLMQYVSANGGDTWDTLANMANRTLRIQHTRPLVDRFIEIRDDVEALDGTPDLDSFIERWLPNFETTTLLAETVSRSREGLHTPKELFDALYNAITHPEVPVELGEVRIMSLHKSKGLSSPYVFIVGCVEGLLPARANEDSTQAEQLAKLEEDRRLFYVGITRVKANLPTRPGYLGLTYARTMSAASAHKSQITPVRTVRGIAHLQASRFIGEMAPHAPAARFNVPL